MVKITILAMSFLFFSCSIFLKDLHSTNSRTLLGILIGLKPPDGDIFISEEPSSIEEGTSKSIQISLGKRPDSDTTVTVSSDSSALAVNGSGTTTLTFTPTNYSRSQTISIDALLDNNTEDETGTITISTPWYGVKAWRVANKDMQGADNWLSIFPENIYLPFGSSTANLQVKLNKKPSEDILVNISTIYNQNPYSGSSYSLKGMVVSSSLTFTPSNYQKPQTAILISRDVIFNPDIILNSGTFRILASSTTFSSKGDIRVTTSSLDANCDVTTIAGSVQGFLDRPLVTDPAAMFNKPRGLATDKTNLYVSDTDNHRIRKIVISTGVVTTIAGSGTAGSLNGIGTAAQFNKPYELTLIGSILYVADSYNHSIRKIDSSGVVTTIAGSGTAGSLNGIGTAAQFNEPYGIATDGTNLYVADTFSQMIRKVDVSTGVVTTIAGNGTIGAADGIGTAARFNFPIGIDSDGVHLFVADTYNNKIRKIVIASGAVTTIAGSGTAGTLDGVGTAAQFSSPVRIATDATSLYINDSFSNRIRKMELSSGVVTTIAGSGTAGTLDGIGTAAQINGPWGLISDGADLFISEIGSHRIRKISKRFF